MGRSRPTLTDVAPYVWVIHRAKEPAYFAVCAVDAPTGPAREGFLIERLM